KNTVMILLVENSEFLIETIKSRCSTIRINETVSEQTKEDKRINEIFQLLVENEVYYLIKSKLDKIEKTKEAGLFFLDGLEKKFSEYQNIRLKEGLPFNRDRISSSIIEIEKSKKDIIDNYNVSYILRGLIIKLTN
ncbi:MAG: hypothetical protein ACRCUS_05705, partial [Anaerovoracaceae bacterium]